MDGIRKTSIAEFVGLSRFCGLSLVPHPNRDPLWANLPTGYFIDAVGRLPTDEAIQVHLAMRRSHKVISAYHLRRSFRQVRDKPLAGIEIF